MKHHVGPSCPVIVNGEVVVVVRLGCLPRFTRKITICSNDNIQAVGLQMAHEASCTRGKAADWQSLLLKLVFILLRYAQWLGPYENKGLFSENFKMLPKNCALQNCILAGKEVWGEQKVQLGYAVKGAGQQVFSWDVWISAGWHSSYRNLQWF